MVYYSFLISIIAVFFNVTAGEESMFTNNTAYSFRVIKVCNDVVCTTMWTLYYILVKLKFGYLHYALLSFTASQHTRQTGL